LKCNSPFYGPKICEAQLRAETKASWQTNPHNEVEKGKKTKRVQGNIRIRNLRAFEMDIRQK